MGHMVGVVCDSRTGDPAAGSALRRLEEVCALGVIRLPMSRQIGPLDYLAYRTIRQAVEYRLGAQILHGHGAKGGAYARLVANHLKRLGHDVRSVYTPHGGSLHYPATSLKGRLYLNLERRLAPLTDGLIFESGFSAHIYGEKVGPPSCLAVVVPNGLHPHEFYELIVDTDAVDFLFVGELRHIKGVDVFLQALSRVRRDHHVRAVVVGAGRQGQTYRRMATRFGLGRSVRFQPPMPARVAFPRARCLVVPSRAESLPYIVLEAAAARMPIIATRVGGIPEITGDSRMPLVEPGDPVALADQMRAFLDNPRPFVERARMLQASVSKRYTVAAMTRGVQHVYERVLAAQAEPAATS